MRNILRATASALAALALAATAAADTPVAVQTLRLPMSNVHLLKTATPVLVNAGGAGDLEALTAGLREHGLTLQDIKLVILTHGHSDHAGLSAAIRRSGGAKVAMGAGDVPMAQAGHHGTLQPTGFTARLLMRFAIDPAYPAFTPDIVVADELDLRPWGIAGKAVARSGHTAGSLVVLLDDRRAIVGDMLLGGYLGGAFRPAVAGPHYFQADVARNEANMAELLRGGTTTFYLGHGGPVTRQSVLDGFPALAK